MSRPSTSHATVVEFVPCGQTRAKPRKNYVRLTPDARDRLAHDIAELETPGKADYNLLAHQYGVSLRTVQNIAAQVRQDNYVRNQDTGRVLEHPLPQDALLDVAGAHGNAHYAWELLYNTGKYTGTYSTFMRRLGAEHGKNVLLGLRKGTPGMTLRAYQSQDRRPFMQTYTLDLFSLRAPVSDRRRICTPMAALVREDNTGMVVNHYVFDNDQVTASMICSLLGTAFRGTTLTYPLDPDTGEAISADSPQAFEPTDMSVLTVGGLPSFVRSDNAAIFVAREVDEKFQGLGVRLQTSNSYSSHELGAHERKHGTARAQLLRMFPGSSDGPRNAAGELTDDRDPITLTQARDLIAGWVAKHNATIDTQGTSPVQRWLEALADGAHVRFPDPGSVAHLAHLVTGSVTRSGLGVRSANEHYQHPNLTGRSPKRYFIGRWFGDSDHVELWVANSVGTSVGDYVGTAVRQGAFTATDSQRLVAHNARERALVAETITQGRERSTRILDALAPPRPDHDQDELTDDLTDELTDVLMTPGGEADDSSDLEHDGEQDVDGEIHGRVIRTPDDQDPARGDGDASTAPTAGRKRRSTRLRAAGTAALTTDDLLAGLPGSRSDNPSDIDTDWEGR